MEGKKIQLVSDSHPDWPKGTNDYLDFSELQGANEIAAKLKSRAGVYDFLKLKFNPIDEPTCKDMNQDTYNMVLANWKDTDKKNMYLNSGSLIKFSPD